MINEDEVQEARIRGQDDFRAGVFDCPYPPGWPEIRYWLIGQEWEERYYMQIIEDREVA
tara:strand:- start:590 stop:766 length:177 start_codon:yes stop_codon:yes gene_type:complete